MKNKSTSKKAWLFPVLIGGALALAYLALFFFSPCDEYRIAREATCTEDGLGKWVNGWGRAKKESIPAMGHRIQNIRKVAATCTTDGNIAYYVCSECGCCFFDKDASVAISNDEVIIPAYGHSLVEVSGKESTCFQSGNKNFWKCEHCSQLFSKNNITATCSWADLALSQLTHTYENGYCKYCKGSEGLAITGTTVTDIGTCEQECITIPNGVTSIGDFAFRECSSLTSITIPDSVTSIGKWAFYECGSLTSITIPNGVTYIGEWTFYDCRSLTSITIPDGVTSIGWHAFDGCSSLTSITIPDSVTSIVSSAFLRCSSLTSITIPDSVTFIGEYAFSGCNSVTNIVVQEGNKHYDSRNNCNAIIETATNTLITGCQKSIIPSSVTSIGKGAFYGCSGLTSITIPNSVTSIGDSAFSECTGLTSITIPNGVTSIGEYAFHECSSLTSITIPDSVTSFGEYAFYECSSLTSITIPDSVTFIGDFAFSGCNSVTNIVVQEGNKHYDSRNNCNAIIETATNTLITGCQKSIIPSSVTSIGDSAFSECTGLTSIAIPDSVTSIGYNAFTDCSGLTSITIPNGVTSIYKWAFAGCSGLTSVTILDGLTYIGGYAFSYCESLTSVTIPDSVTCISEYAFDGCIKLSFIQYQGTKSQWKKVTKGQNAIPSGVTITYKS